MKLILKNLFGGGSSILYVIFAAAIGGLWLKNDLTMKENAKLEQERDEWKSTALGAQNAIITQAIQSTRQTATQKDLQDADKLIAAVPDSRHCAASEPIAVAFEWLRDYRTGRAEADPD